jgi:hypothetical protein
MGYANGTAFEFARYIATRAPRGTPWTSVYDEMCRVARSRAFRGMGYSELLDAGISLSITSLDHICQLVDKAWDQQSPPDQAT